MDNPDLQREIRLLQEQSKAKQLNDISAQMESNNARIEWCGDQMGNIQAKDPEEYDQLAAPYQKEIDMLSAANRQLKALADKI